MQISDVSVTGTFYAQAVVDVQVRHTHDISFPIYQAPDAPEKEWEG